MSTIRIDGRPAPGGYGSKTWGETLEMVDRALAGDGRIVTAVRIDGVDQPAFRDPALLDDIPPGEAIEIETGRPGALVARTLTEATEGLAALCEQLPALARLFRSGLEVEASAQLGTVGESLGAVLTIGAASALALRVNLDTIPCNGQRASALIEDIGRALDTLLDAQQARDWTAVADTLEYELTAALERWGGVFDALQRSVGEAA